MSDARGHGLDLGRFELCLNVADLTRSTVFYEKLGLARVGGVPAEGWAILQNGATRIGLFQGHVGGNVLNFRGADVFALAEELATRGIALESGPERESDGTDGATLRDPDGNLIYFNTP